jgi:hypothetical protein
MPLYRVTESRVMTGYEKASFVYEAGEVIDSDHLPEGHLKRLQAVGAVVPVEPAAPPASSPKKVKA